MPLLEELTIARLCSGIDAPEDVLAFAHTPGTRVEFGCGAIAKVGEICKELGGNRVLVVTDHGIRDVGHSQRAAEQIEKAGLKATIYSDVHENPTTEDVYRCVEVAKEAEIDLIVGLGGGSSMDTAKGCNFIFTNGGRMRDYWGIGKAGKEMLPLVAIPTTAGTGSECQSFALIADAETHMKMACGDKKAAARVAILDPQLTATQPAMVTAHTGIDALTHAVETAVTKKRTETSAAYSHLAFELLNRGLEEVAVEPDSLEARSRMQLGAAYAGTAIENSMLGAAHAAANPLTAHYDVVHGEAVGVMLPHVIRLNSANEEIAANYASLYAGDLADRMTQLLEVVGMPTTLAGYDVDDAVIPVMAKEASEQWTAQFNPVMVGSDDFETLYRAAL